VTHLGEKIGKLNKTDLKEISVLIHDVNWNTLEASYGSDANDSQRKELYFTSPSGNKKVIYYRLEPKEIRTLEYYIDSITNYENF
jgi:hypothetical protein